jgi:hypothetical protein
MKKYFALAMLTMLGTSVFAQFTTLTGLTINWTDKRPDYFAITNPPTGPETYYSFITQGVMANLLIYPKYHFYGAAPKQVSSRSKRKPPPPSPYSLSAGLPLQIGLTLGGGGAQGFSFAYAAGAAADINFGNFRPSDDKSIGGFFAGLGLGAMNTNQISVLQQPTQIPTKPSGTVVSYSSQTDFQNNYKFRALSVGPLVHAGAQIQTGRSTIGLRGAYQIGLNSFGKDYMSITLIYTGGGFMNNNIMFW